MEPTAIQHLMSAIRQNTSGTKHIPKLPPKLIGKDKDVIQAVLMELYQDVVEDRGCKFREIAGTEVAENIAAAAEWMTGPRLKSSLLLQGTLGSGKSSLMNALCSLYRFGASGIYKCTALMVYDQFKAKLDKQPSYYDEFKKADYLFLDDLGTEPAKCKDYGVDYTPLPELIYERYEKQRVTIISTNLSDDRIAAWYGKRVLDRFEEMCERIVFLGDSYREQIGKPAE